MSPKKLSAKKSTDEKTDGYEEVDPIVEQALSAPANQPCGSNQDPVVECFNASKLSEMASLADYIQDNYEKMSPDELKVALEQLEIENKKYKSLKSLLKSRVAEIEKPDKERIQKEKREENKKQKKEKTQEEREKVIQVSIVVDGVSYTLTMQGKSRFGQMREALALAMGLNKKKTKYEWKINNTVVNPDPTKTLRLGGITTDMTIEASIIDDTNNATNEADDLAVPLGAHPDEDDDEPPTTTDEDADTDEV